MFPDECLVATLALPLSAPNDGALVCLRVTNDWSKVLLDLSAILQDDRLWVEGTDLDTAYVYAQQLEQIIVNATEDCPVTLPDIGDIKMHGGEFPPSGWHRCEGAELDRETYATLFSVIGTSFGVGDGSTTFNLPNFIDRSPMGYSGAVPTIGATAGELTVTLNDAQIPNHNHTLNDPGHAHQGSNGGSFQVVGGTGTKNAQPFAGSTARVEANTSTNTTGITTNTTGGGGSHPNLHPVLGCLFCIYAGM